MGNQLELTTSLRRARLYLKAAPKSILKSFRGVYIWEWSSEVTPTWKNSVLRKGMRVGRLFAHFSP